MIRSMIPINAEEGFTFFRKFIVKSSEEQSWFGVYILYRAQVSGVD